MAKRTIRVKLPRHKPNEFIDLMKDIVRRHEELGISSPLSDPSFVDMADFKTKLFQADAFREESIEHRAMAEVKMEQAKNILGTGIGMTVTNEGTLYSMLEGIKKVLLIKHWNNPEALSEYGFNIVVGTAKFIGRPRKKKE